MSWTPADIGDLTGRRAVVTGANAGLGLEIARELAAHGAEVVLACRSTARGEAAARRIGGRTSVRALDLADLDSIAAFADAFTGRLDLLVNNAGSFGPARDLDEISLQEWQDVVAVNLTGVFLCSREAFRVMRTQSPQGGRIINNGSISAQVPRPLSAAYTATKHAVTGLTKSLSLDGRPYDIACGQLDVGNAATEMTDRMAAGVRQADGSTRPEPRMDVEGVGRAVAYMAGLPLEANVANLTVHATKMPYVGRG
jgi:NAD(P)-dependent dehydrogenase (short-subunit alcohol dehydrogenase family)